MVDGFLRKYFTKKEAPVVVVVVATVRLSMLMLGEFFDQPIRLNNSFIDLYCLSAKFIQTFTFEKNPILLFRTPFRWQYFLSNS